MLHLWRHKILERRNSIVVIASHLYIYEMRGSQVQLLVSARLFLHFAGQKQATNTTGRLEQDLFAGPIRTPRMEG